MKNIILTRIDDRLIHGQVVTAWVKEYPINTILIVDDALSKNSLMQRIYKAAAPSNIELLLYDKGDSISYLQSEETVNQSKDNIMILTKGPEIIEELIENGVEITEVNLGGMGANEHRKKFNRNVSASEEEIETFRRLINNGISMYYQLVPNDKKVDVKSLL